MATFLDSVNRVLRTNGFLSDDDDDLTSFTTTQHQASMNIAQIAVKNTLSGLTAERLIPYEESETTLTYVDSQRNYTLASDFVRFAGEPYLVELDTVTSEATTRYMYEYKGGEDRLRRTIHNYRVQTGSPLWWYSIKGASKQIGFWPVPDSGKAGTQVRYVYEKDVSVVNAGDTIPLHTSMEFDAFCNMAGRMQKYIFEKLPLNELENDAVYSNSKSTLYELLRVTNPAKKYGYEYR